jgi:hypothetical protein
MADFCKDCSIRVFGDDMGDLACLCDETQMVHVLCEGCGWIYVDCTGKKVELPDEFFQ